MSDNAAEESRAALLVTAAPDPATQGNTLFNVVKELSEADYNRYKAAYKTLDSILVRTCSPITKKRSNRS